MGFTIGHFIHSLGHLFHGDWLIQIIIVFLHDQLREMPDNPLDILLPIHLGLLCYFLQTLNEDLFNILMHFVRVPPLILNFEKLIGISMFNHWVVK